MADPKHVEILKQGVDAWNRWRIKNRFVVPDLTGVSFLPKHLWQTDISPAAIDGGQVVRLEESGLEGVNFERTILAWAVLREVNLQRAYLLSTRLRETDLTKANLRLCQLVDADLVGARLCGANFEAADCGGADFFSANLTEANLSRALLSSVSFHHADLSSARFDGATLCDVLFTDANLSDAKGLESCTHFGPSTIDHQTLAKSGKLSPAFLRSCGIPVSLIESLQSLVAESLLAEPLRRYSCFISHSAQDESVCDRLNADLIEKGVRTWYFKENAQWGEPVWGEIDRGIKGYDKLIVVCSKDSLQSGPVLREIERALTREDREHKNILSPIRLDDYLFDEWEHSRKDDVLAKVVGDFRGWDQSTTEYEAAFLKLLDGLRDEEMERVDDQKPEE